MENQSGNNIKILKTDNGKEYVNKNLEHFCEECGIQMQHSVPYTPQQNGVAEHKIAHSRRWKPTWLNKSI